MTEQTSDRKSYWIAYHQRPYVKAKRKAYYQRPEVKARIKAYARAYQKRPGVREKQKVCRRNCERKRDLVYKAEKYLSRVLRNFSTDAERQAYREKIMMLVNSPGGSRK